MSTVAAETRFDAVVSIASKDVFVAALTAESPQAAMESGLRRNQGPA
jgi:hypothetical protein